jgi:hypothetical protein
MIIEERKFANGKKIYYRFVWGRSASDKMSAGIYTWSKPKTPVAVYPGDDFLHPVLITIHRINITGKLYFIY